MNPGICGIISLDGHDVDRDTFERMQNLLTSKGKTECVRARKYCLAQAGYGSSCHKNACVFTRENTSFCFEGRIDNRQTLAAELSLPQDAEYGTIIFLAYRRWREDLVKFLHGAFTLVIVDQNNGKAVLANDHMALRKLFFRIDKSKIVFGSDVRQILIGTGTRAKLHLPKAAEFLSPMCVIDEGWSKPEETLFESVQMLDWATHVVVQLNTGHVSKSRYWNPPQRLIRTTDSVEEYASEFTRLFYKVLSEQLGNSGSTLGSELSGGIDSGVLVCVASDILRKRGLFPTKNLHTYTLVLDDENSSKESEKIERIKGMYPEISTHFLDSSNFCGYLELSSFRSCRVIHQPCRMNIPEGFALLAQEASEDGCEVLFSGEGADWYLEGSDLVWDSLVRSRNWSRLKNYMDVLLSRGSFGKVVRYLLRYGIRPLAPRWFSVRSYINEYYSATKKGNLPDVFTRGFKSLMEDCLSDQMKILASKNSFESWSQRQEYDLLFPPNHNWQGVAINPEPCFPYLDRRLIEFGLEVPPEYKFVLADSNKSHYGSRKMLQRVGFEGIVPPEILWSQEKIRYGSPVVKRLRQYFNPVFGTTKNIHTADLGIVDVGKLMSLASPILCSDAIPEDHPLIPWLDSILGLEVWLQANYEDGVFS